MSLWPAEIKISDMADRKFVARVSSWPWRYKPCMSSYLTKAVGYPEEGVEVVGSAVRCGLNGLHAGWDESGDWPRRL